MRVSISLVLVALLSYIQTTDATGQLYARNKTDAAIAVQVLAPEKSVIGSHLPLESPSSEGSKGNTGHYSALIIPSHVTPSQPSSKLRSSSFSLGAELSSPVKSSSRSSSHGTTFQVVTSASRGSTPASHESRPTISSVKSSEKTWRPASTRSTISKPASHSAKPVFISSTFSHSVKQSSKSVTAHNLSPSVSTVKPFVKSLACTSTRTSHSHSHSTPHISSRKLTSHSSKSSYRLTHIHEFGPGPSSAKSMSSSILAFHSTTSAQRWSRSHPRHSATSFMTHPTWSPKPLRQMTKSARTRPMSSSYSLHSSSHSNKVSSPLPFPTGKWPRPAPSSSVPCTITKTYTRTTTIYPHPSSRLASSDFRLIRSR